MGQWVLDSSQASVQRPRDWVNSGVTSQPHLDRHPGRSSPFLAAVMVQSHSVLSEYTVPSRCSVTGDESIWIPQERFHRSEWKKRTQATAQNLGGTLGGEGKVLSKCDFLTRERQSHRDSITGASCTPKPGVLWLGLQQGVQAGRSP